MTDDDFCLNLDDPQQAGVFFVTEDDLDTLASSAQDAALLLRRIDLHGCDGKQTLLQRLADALALPHDQSRNWDALSDQLRDLSWLPARGYVLLLSHAASLRDTDEASFDTLLNIAEDASLAWQQHAQPFWVFLALPESDFPSPDCATR